MRQAGQDDPALAKAALDGLRAYQSATPPAPRPLAQAVATIGDARLVDLGGDGPPVVLIPSLINPPTILDLDPDVSLAAPIVAMGHRVLLVDWGPANARAALDIAGHVEQLLLPLLATLERPPIVVGYCLGGTMAIAAASLAPVAGLVTLASPWDFSGYPDQSRMALDKIWTEAQPMAAAMGALPMEVLQAAFWSLDPVRTVRKFARFGALDRASPDARRFVEMEEWANSGEALPYPAARELMQDLFRDNLSGRGRWVVGDRAVHPPAHVPMLHCTASDDRIAPASTAPPGDRLALESGHVGMIVGSKRLALHRAIGHFLDRSAGSDRA